MKQFFKYVLATVVGVFLVGIILTILSICSLMGVIAVGNTPVPVKDNSVLVIQLQGSIEERTTDNPLAGLWGSSVLESQGLDDLLAAIKKAKEEDNVKGIYLEAGSLNGAMPATLQALRRALADFKKSGKFIVSYGDAYTQGAYYLCSVADTLMVNPQGLIDWSGLSSQVVYYKDLLDKAGVEMQVVKVGTYKSAVEPFMLSEMSEANREQILTYDTEIWGEMTRAVSKSRGISAERLNALADSSMLFKEAALYKKEKLADKIAYNDAVPQVIANMMGLESPDDYATVTVSDLAGLSASEPKGTGGDIVAVYYAVGGIVDEAVSGFRQEPEIVGRTVARDLQALAENDDVKAVVLRVNSGGGSAYASEQIWHQVMNIKAKKPIVVSMGDMAASGGYYISCAANYIYAEPTTITGSIGIFGLFPCADKLLGDKLGIHISTVKTNALADFGDISRPFTEQERAMAQQYVNRGYDLFTRRCAQGRKMKQDSIKTVGEGRVWTGLHAKQIGLVDELGGLNSAIAKAKRLAGVDDASIITYPAKPSILDNLLQEVDGGSYADAQIRQSLGDYYPILSDLKNVGRKTGIQAALPYHLRFKL